MSDLSKEQAKQRAFEAIQLVRRRGMSLTQAARAAHTTIPTVRKHVRSTVQKLPSGRFHVTPGDRLKRTLRFLTPEGVISLGVQGSRKASGVARYWAAVDRFLITGNTDALLKFEGKSLRAGGRSFLFVTDHRTLGRLAIAGEVSFEDLYALVT